MLFYSRFVCFRDCLNIQSLVSHPKQATADDKYQELINLIYKFT